MTDRITSIEMQAFRGVPQTFTVDLSDDRSCVVLGDNGTGKSSIADAVEWYFEGRIEFLTKEGRSAGIRHRGATDDLETKVTISTDGSLGGVITRSQPSPQAVQDVGRSELFLLRGRTLAEFVDKTKGENWKVLSELLGLEAIDQMRLDLQHAKNDLETQAQNAATELSRKRSVLQEMVPDISEQGILEAIATKCQAADVPPPRTLDEALDPQWLQASVGGGSKDQRSGVLRAALGELRTAAEEVPPLDPIDTWNRFITEGGHDQLPLGLYRAADSLLRSGHAPDGECPLCGQPFDLNVLAEKVATELRELESTAQALESARQAARHFVGRLRDTYQTRDGLFRRASGQGVELVRPPAGPHSDLSRRVEEASEIDRSIVEAFQAEVADWDAHTLRVLASEIPAPASERDKALVDLVTLRTAATAWRDARHRDTASSAAADLAERVFNAYQTRQHNQFKQIIEQISGRVAEIYQFLHPEVGIGAVAIETVDEKGAELSVDFHGRPEIPPHRVLSESHLNSLGIALFLAMAETFNDNIGFLVLDDVVNSFDREHRGRLAELLADQFDETQLIVLTHDEQFFTQILRRAPSWRREELTSWSYGEGPRRRQYEEDRLLAAAKEALSTGDRAGAAQKGRLALEEFLQEACENLGALLPFRRGQRNDQRMADEVMRGLRRTLTERAKQLYSEIGSLLNGLEADLQASLNVESHASQTSASKREVADALSRIVALRACFTCGDCGTRVWYRGTPDSSLCKCGGAQFPPPSVPTADAVGQSTP